MIQLPVSFGQLICIDSHELEAEHNMEQSWLLLHCMVVFLHEDSDVHWISHGVDDSEQLIN